MSDHVVANALQDYLRLKDELSKILELKEDAFCVFDSESIASPKLDEMMSFYNGSWNKLLRYSGIHMQKEHEIYLAFTQVTSATITREQFNEHLLPSRKAVEDSIAALEASVEEKRQQLLNLYDDSFSEDELSFIFTAPQVKERFINFLHS